MLLRAARWGAPAWRALGSTARTRLAPLRHTFGSSSSSDAVGRRTPLVHVVTAGAARGVGATAPPPPRGAAPTGRQQPKQERPPPPESFTELGLMPQLISGLEQQGITKPTEIQVGWVASARCMEQQLTCMSGDAGGGGTL